MKTFRGTIALIALFSLFAVRGRSQEIEALGLDGVASEEGFVVTKLAAGGPATSAGLRVGDLLISVEGEPLRNSTEMFELMSHKKEGSGLLVEYVRQGRHATAKLIIGTTKGKLLVKGATNRPRPQVPASPQPNAAPVSTTTNAGPKKSVTAAQESELTEAFRLVALRCLIATNVPLAESGSAEDVLRDSHRKEAEVQRKTELDLRVAKQLDLLWLKAHDTTMDFKLIQLKYANEAFNCHDSDCPGRLATAALDEWHNSDRYQSFEACRASLDKELRGQVAVDSDQCKSK
jgi:hypothetical protein